MASPVELLGDLVAVAQEKLGIPAERLLREARLSGLESVLNGLAADAEGGEVQASRVEAVAICGAWVIGHQPFPDYNREIGDGYLRLMMKRAEIPWPRSKEDANRLEAMLRALELGAITEAKFVDWFCLKVATA